QFILCFLIMVIPTMLMGATFPVVSKIITQRMESVGSDVGRVYSANTLGAILGSFSAGFLLIPLIGIRNTTLLAASLNLVVALTAIVVSGSRRWKFTAGLGCVLLIMVFLLVRNSEARPYFYNFYIASRYVDYRAFVTDSSNYRLLFHRDDAHGTVKVFFNRLNNSMFLENGGKIEGSTGGDMYNTLLLAYLPLAANPGAKNFLGIGLGTGITMRAAKGKLDNVDWVEINPAVVQAVKQFFYPDLMRSGINMIIADARNYLQVTDKKYDIISSEPSYPTEASVANLFTIEFFRAAERRLNPGGVFCQWFPYYMFSDRDVTIMLKTFAAVFPYTSIWKVPMSGDLLFLGSKERISMESESIIREVKELNEFPVALPFVISRTQEQVREIIDKSGDMRINTDDRPLLEFTAARNLVAGVKR
ncbi:MAG: fused MFS/spermidine synthase, partial [bacterium]